MSTLDRDVFLFGLGLNFYSYADRLDQVLHITGFVDNNPEKWGSSPFGDNRIVISPNEMAEYAKPLAVIVPMTETAVEAITAQCKALGVDSCRVSDVLAEYPCVDYKVAWPESIQRGRIHRFIDLQLRNTTTCNFHCEYCYVWRHDGYIEGRKTSDYTPKQIRHALSYQRCGGPCFVNICASGETMLSQDIVELVAELLKEGHYVSVVTNGTVTRPIEKILMLPAALQERMFFKLSYHYLELQRTNLENRFWENVSTIANSACSYTIEITPHDNLIPHIKEIKEIFKQKANGAMPHITYARDSTKSDFDLLSELSLQEYEHVWGQFDSALFSLKNKLYNKHINDFCYAGNWTFNVSLQSGNMQTCYRQTQFFPILSDVDSPLPELALGEKCAMRYCFNGHAFIAWGAVPTIKCDSYLAMRDREDSDGNHWVKPAYARAMKQKLYDNNFVYHDTWPDYQRLFARGRLPALILFNSPDYSNLGDHAIALGTERFFKKYFPQWELIQVSCEEYVRENLKIKQIVQEQDVLMISGGGYLGTLWPRFDDIVRHIVSAFPKNKIFILPQTAYYEDSEFGKAEIVSKKQCFDAHTELYLAFREQKSFAFAQKMFGADHCISLIPDMALFLRYHAKQKRKGALLCFRRDKEALGNQKQDMLRYFKSSTYPFDTVDTIAESDVNLVTRETSLRELLDRFSRATVVLTDRLHGMLLCAVCGTPCLAFDNLSGKVSGTYEWIKKFEFIKMHETGADYRKEIDSLIRCGSREPDWCDIDRMFAEYAAFIKAKIGD